MNNLYLIKMGMDKNDGTNHRIRFYYHKNIRNDKQARYTIDFMMGTPMADDGRRINELEDTLLFYNGQYDCEEKCLPIDTRDYSDNCETTMRGNVKYTYENILKVVENITHKKFDKVVLLDSRYLKNYNWENFDSTNCQVDKASYEMAERIEKEFSPKVLELKREMVKKNIYRDSHLESDNSSYYFGNENEFKILIHHMGYNDIIKFDITKPFSELEKQFSDYVEEKLTRPTSLKYNVKYIED